MSKLGVVEDTLFVPMLGRIYASERYPQVLYDQKALELKKKLPSDLLEYGSQNQYTLLASATRSANMDRYIRSFLQRRPNGVIAQLGCGLETAYYLHRRQAQRHRNDIPAHLSGDGRRRQTIHGLPTAKAQDSTGQRVF